MLDMLGNLRFLPSLADHVSESDLLLSLSLSMSLLLSSEPVMELGEVVSITPQECSIRVSVAPHS